MSDKYDEIAAKFLWEMYNVKPKTKIAKLAEEFRAAAKDAFIIGSDSGWDAAVEACEKLLESKAGKTRHPAVTFDSHYEHDRSALLNSADAIRILKRGGK